MDMPFCVPSGRRWPVGADLSPGDGVHFRVWAPGRRQVAVVLEAGPGNPATVPLEPEPGGGGYFSRRIDTAAAGTRYRYRLDDGDYRYPDPASRFQPEGPHDSSEVIDPEAYRWQV